MTDLRELYHEIVLEHGKSPRNFHEIKEPDRTAEGFNPLCGDRITVFLNLNDGEIREIAFQGRACAICTATASIMTESIKQKPMKHARDLFDWFRAALTSEAASEANPPEPRLGALLGVRRFPMRVKCAMLPWHTMLAALENRGEPVSTE